MMQTSYSPRLLFYWFIFLFAVFLAQTIPVYGQVAPDADSTTTPSEQSLPAEAPTSFIPVTEVPFQARILDRTLRRLRTEVLPDEQLQAIEEALPDLTAELAILAADTDQQDLNSLRQRELSDLQVIWRTQQSRLEDWGTYFSERFAYLKDTRVEIISWQALWQDTQRQANAVAAPPALLNRIGAIRVALDTVRVAVRTQIENALNVEDRITEALFTVEDRLTRIEAALQQSRKNLFAQNAPPLWAAPPGRSFSGHIARSVTELINSLTAFARFNQARILLHVGLFLLLVALMFLMRRRSETWVLQDEDDPLQASRHLRSYPVSTATLIALIFVIWLYPNRPRAIGEIALLLMLIPLMRVLPGLIRHDLRWPMYVLGLLLFTDIAGYHLTEPGLPRRLLLLTMSVVALATLLWTLRPGGPAALAKPKRIGRILIRLTPIAVAFFALAIIANLVGYVSLADLLTRVPIESITLVVFLYVLILALSGFISLLLRRRQISRFHIVEQRVGQVQHAIITFLRVGAFLIWIQITLRLLGFYEPLVNTLTEAVNKKWVFGTTEVSIGQLISFLLILAVTGLLARLVRLLLEEDVFVRIRLPRGLPAALSMVVRYSIIAFGFLLAMSAAGVDLGSFGLLAGALGVGIGFGLQNIIANFVSGLILAFERPIHVGDTIKVGEAMGNVNEIGVRSSKVRLFDGSELIVPNSDLISNKVLNWTRTDRRRRHKMKVKVAYGSDPHQVISILLDAAKQYPQTFEEPAPVAVFNGFGDNGLDFSLYYWTPFDGLLKITSEMALMVYDALETAGIRVPIPRQELTVTTKEDPTENPEPS